jgi:hypothetical protein
VTTKRKSPRRKLKRSQMHWPQGSDEKAMRDDLARELLSVCMTALQAYGLDLRRIVELARQAVALKGSTPTMTRVLQDMYWMGELISEWAENPAYLDGEGRPQVIQINGSGISLKGLAQKFFGHRSVQEILELGCQTQVMERVGDKKVALLNDCVMFTGDPFLMLAHSIRSVRRFLSSADYNAWAPIDQANIWPERTAFSAVPEADFPEFIKVMRPQIASLLEMGNRWLASRAAVKQRTGSRRKITMGIQAFVFRE